MVHARPRWAHSSAVQSGRLITGKTLVRIQVGPWSAADRGARAGAECGRVAQLAEHLDHNQGVTGSSPVPPTIVVPAHAPREIAGDPRDGRAHSRAEADRADARGAP